VWVYHNDDWPELIDHINRDKLDNRIENLRVIDKSSNGLNMSEPHKDNKLGVLGVCQRQDTGKFIAQFRGKRLGEFDSIEDAKARYDEVKFRTNEKVVERRTAQAF
jgi:hypothetical protein